MAKESRTGTSREVAYGNQTNTPGEAGGHTEYRGQTWSAQRSFIWLCRTVESGIVPQVLEVQPA